MGCAQPHTQPLSHLLYCRGLPLHGRPAGFWLGFARGAWKGTRKGEVTLRWLLVLSPEVVDAGMGTVALEDGLLGSTQTSWYQEQQT